MGSMVISRVQEVEQKVPEPWNAKAVRGRAGEVGEVAGMVSPGTGRRYPLSLVCSQWRVPRSTVYARRRQGSGSSRQQPLNRGPRTVVSDCSSGGDPLDAGRESVSYGGSSQGACEVTSSRDLRR